MRTLTLIPQSGQYDAVVDRVVDAETIDCCLLVPVRVRLRGLQVDGISKRQLVARMLQDRLAKQVVTLDLDGKSGTLTARIKTDSCPDIGSWLVGLNLATEGGEPNGTKTGIPWREIGDRSPG